MRVCVVGAGGREHALAEVLARTGRRRGHARQPRHPVVDAGAARGARRRPVRHRPRGTARRRPGRPAAGPGPLVFGPGADGARLEGSKAWMKEVLVARRCAHRRPPRRSAPATSATPSTSSRVAARALRREDRRTRRRQGGARHRRRSAEAESTTCGPSVRRDRCVVIEEGLSRTRGVAHVPVRRPRGSCPWRRRRTTSASATATPGPTPAAWARTRRCPRSTAPSGERLAESLVAPTLARAAPARHRLPRRALRRADAHARRARRCSSTTSASAIPRPRSSCPASTATSPRSWPRRRPALCARPRPSSTTRRSPWCAATEGYPVAPRTGDVIDGLDAAGAVPGVTVYCAGVAAAPDGRLVTAGGRVLAVTGIGPAVDDARRSAYEGVHQLSWPGLHWRSDIARMRESDRDDPALRAAGDGGDVHRQPRASGAGSRSSCWPPRPGRSSAWCRRPMPRPAGRGAPVVDDGLRRRRRRARAHHRPRRGRVRRRGAGGHRDSARPGRVDPLRADVVRRGRHGAGAGSLRDAADLLLAASVGRSIAALKTARARATATRS